MLDRPEVRAVCELWIFVQVGEILDRPGVDPGRPEPLRDALRSLVGGPADPT